MIFIETLAEARDKVQAELAAAEEELAEFVKDRAASEGGRSLSAELWSRASRAAKLEGQLAILKSAAATEALVERNPHITRALVLAQIRMDAETELLREDDTWSGRGNDVRRCYADGVKDAARELFSYLRYEEKKLETA